MATGDVTGAKRPRYQANERFDSGDADAASRAPQDFDDSLQRSLVTTPRAAAGAVMPGMIVTGLSLTLNPTGPADGKIRINTEVGVAIDANGRTIIKPNGLTVDVTIPVGSHQVYLFHQETPGDNATRRFLTVTAPFTEYPAAMNTTFQSTFGTYVRAGTNASTVNSDVVNGVTTPLVCIAIVSNAAGSITCVGYNAITAPNGSDITNRLSVVSAPTTPPTVNTRNGSLQTLHDVLIAALYTAGQTAWKGSDFLTPVAANNFGAYSVPAGGADKAFRQALGYVTIGNGTTILGDFNVSDYANNKLLLDAAIASLPAAGGTLFLKRGVALTGFGGLTVTMPAGKSVEIVGDHSTVPSTIPQLDFAAGEWLICNATGKLTMRNLHVRWVNNAVVLTTAPFIGRNLLFEKLAAVDSGAALQGTAVTDLDLEDVDFVINVTAQVTTGMGVRCTGITRRVRTNRMNFTFTGLDCGGIQIDDLREDVRLLRTTVLAAGSFTGNFGNPFAYLFNLNTTDNAIDIRNRVIRGFVNSVVLVGGINLGNIGNILIEEMDMRTGRAVVTSALYSGAGPIKLRRSTLAQVLLQGGIPDLQVQDVSFLTTAGGSLLVGDGLTALGSIQINRCKFQGPGFTPLVITGTTMRDIGVIGCEFDGLGNTAAPPRCAQIYGTSLALVKITDNVVTNFQNVAYVGADEPAYMFTVAGNNLYNIICKNNVASRIMESSTGAARKGAYLLQLESADFSSQTLSLLKLVVSNNDIGSYSGGAAGDYVQLLRVHNHVQWTEISIINNTLHTELADAGGIPRLAGLCEIFNDVGNVTSGEHFRFDNNHFYMRQGAGAPGGAIYVDFVKIDDILGVTQSYDFSFQDNNFFVADSAPAFDLVNAWGITILQWPVANFVFKNNVAGYFGTGINDYFNTRMTNTPTNTMPAFPGAGVAWTENINIKRLA